MHRHLNLAIVISALVVLRVGLALPAQAGPPEQGPPPPQPSDSELVEQLQQATNGGVTIAYQAETGKVGFIGTPPGRPIAQPPLLAANASADLAARGFLAAYGQLFGLHDVSGELAVMKEKSFEGGYTMLRYQQVHQGIPVLAGELIVHVGADRSVRSASGEILPAPQVATQPAIDAETARQRALAALAADHALRPEDLKASAPELWIYNPALLGSSASHISSLVWRMEVTPLELLPIRELVLVDAHQASIVLRINQIETARDRRTYDGNNGLSLPGTLRCSESNPTCSGGDFHEVDAHNYAGATYDFYAGHYGRDSIDNAGMTLISTVHHDVNYGNAFWNGSQMVYGDLYGFPRADDVVAHELTHGVTQYESGLIYHGQSGAINEALSDIWGEFVDLAQATGNDAGDVRWRIGEDISGLGAIRDMSNPTAFDSGLGLMPDRMSSPYYYCGTEDEAGVHHNSGIAGKAAYLMVDGGTFNGYTISGLGINTTARIWYEVQTNLLTSGADYQDLYNALNQACTNLGLGTTTCQQVSKASLATEMNQLPAACVLDQVVYLPFVIKGGTAGGIVNGNFESGPTGWTVYSTHGWDPITTRFPPGVTPHRGAWAVWLGGEYDEISYIQQQVTVPSSTPYLAYWNWIASADLCGFDYGGVIINGTSVVNSYTLCTSTNTGGWVKHVVNLTPYAGRSVSMQIRAETDGSNNSNLFVDDVAFQASATLVEDSPGLLNENQALPRPGAGVPSGKRGTSPERLLVP